jgi:hypothetical protein
MLDVDLIKLDTDVIKLVIDFIKLSEFIVLLEIDGIHDRNSKLSLMR